MPIYAIYELLSTLLPSVSRNVHWPLISFKIVKENDGTPSLVWFGQVPAGSNKFQPGTLLKENRESFRLLPWQGPGSVLRVSVDVHDVPILRSCPATRQLDFPSKPTVPGKPTVPDTPTVPGNLVTQKPGNSETRVPSPESEKLLNYHQVTSNETPYFPLLKENRDSFLVVFMTYLREV